MPYSDEQNRRIKENIKSAWQNCDFLGLIHAGLDSFMNLLFSGAPISFQQFLEDTSVCRFVKHIGRRTRKECSSLRAS